MTTPGALCPRCGRRRVGAFRYCLDCGFDHEAADAGQVPEAVAPPRIVEPPHSTAARPWLAPPSEDEIPRMPAGREPAPPTDAPVAVEPAPPADAPVAVEPAAPTRAEPPSAEPATEPASAIPIAVEAPPAREPEPAIPIPAGPPPTPEPAWPPAPPAWPPPTAAGVEPERPDGSPLPVATRPAAVETAVPSVRISRARTFTRLLALGAVLLVGVIALVGLTRPAANPFASASPRASTAASSVATPSSAPTPAFTILPPSSFDPVSPTGALDTATVTRVVDGDTIRVMLGTVDTPVRYIGIDAPEPDTPDPIQKPLAEAATAANAALVEGKVVILEQDVSQTDRFDRLLRHVWIESESGGFVLVNFELVRAGFAQVATFPPDVKYVDALVAAQDAARAESRGLWSASSQGGSAGTPPPALDEELYVIAPGDGRHFAGTVGRYTWTALAFTGERMTVHWDASNAGNAACRVDWRLDPNDGGVIGESADVAAGGRHTSDQDYATPFYEGELVVESSCQSWNLSMRADPGASTAG
jgi:micrococcal nuclease